MRAGAARNCLLDLASWPGLPHGPEVDGMPPLKAYLLKTRQHDIAENVISRLLTYATGHELNTRDRYEVETILSQSEKDGFLLQDMIVLICQSPAFRQNQ